MVEYEREWVEINRESPVRTNKKASVWSRIGPVLYPRLPYSLQTGTNMGPFKRRLKCWIRNNIPIYIV